MAAASKAVSRQELRSALPSVRVSALPSVRVSELRLALRLA